MAKETMQQFAQRRTRAREAKMKATEASSSPVRRPGKNTADSKGPGPNDWTKSARTQKPGC